VPLPDPLTLLVADFTRTLVLASEAPGVRKTREIVERMELLDHIVTAFAQHLRGEAAP
jgi:hypothetical protein